MKEVVKVSISGIAFSFDAEAYQVMKDYLDKLETGYAKNPTAAKSWPTSKRVSQNSY